ARLEGRVQETFGAGAAHKLLGLWQDAGDDRVDARGGRMKAVAVIEPGFTGNAVEEEGIKQKIVAGGEFGVDRLEIAPIVGAEIGCRPHAGEQYCHVPGGEPAHNLPQRLARDPRIDPAQHVVGAELDDDRIGPLRHRPVEAGEPIGSGIAGDPALATSTARPLALSACPGLAGKVPSARGPRPAVSKPPNTTIRTGGPVAAAAGARSATASANIIATSANVWTRPRQLPYDRGSAELPTSERIKEHR